MRDTPGGSSRITVQLRERGEIRLLTWRWRFDQWRGRMLRRLVFRLPQKVRRWAFVRVAVEYHDNPTDTTVGDIMASWGPDGL